MLKPGSRLTISDGVTTTELPPAIWQDLGDFYTVCVSGASSTQELHTSLAASGFTDVSIELKEETKDELKDWVLGAHVEDYIVYATLQARKL